MSNIHELAFSAEEIDELLDSVDKKTIYQDATQSEHGLMSTTDKTKLDALPTAQQIDGALNAKVDKEAGKGLSTNDYTDADKAKVASALQTETDPTVPSWAKQQNKPSYNYSEIGNTPDLSQFVTKTVNDLTNYYLKSEVAALIAAIQQFHYEIYASLPQSGEGNVLYLIGPTGTGSDRYEEYVYANNAFTKIGDTSIDLSGYVTISALNTALADYTTTSSLTALLSNKADKVSNATSGNFAGLDANGNPTDSGSKASDFATAAQGAKADTAYQKPSSGIPESDLSSDVQQALQKHFKGWYDSSSNLPSSPVVGDYAYVKGATSSDPAAIYECTTAGTWSDSGRTADTSNVQTFASNQEVNEVHIVNDLTTGGIDDVLSAEQGKKIGNDVYGQYDFKDLNVTLINQRYYVVNIDATKIKVNNNSYTYMSSVRIQCQPGDKFRVFGLGFNQYVSRLWVFSDDTNIEGEYSILSHATQSVNTRDNGEIIIAPNGSAYLTVCFYNYDSNTDKIQKYAINEQSGLKRRVEELEESTLKNDDIVDNLISGGQDKPLSAEQGKKLKTELDYLEGNEITFVNYPCRVDNSLLGSGSFKGYKVDVSALYAKGIRGVMFRASSFNHNALNHPICGAILNANNEQESNTAATEELEKTQWCILPIKNTSKTLFATYCFDNTYTSVEIFTPSYVLFVNDLVYEKLTSTVDEEAIQQLIDEKFPETFLPSVTYGVIGDTLQIFNRGVVRSFNPRRFYNNFKCNQGKIYERYFEVTPTLVSGNIPTNLTIKHSLINDSFDVSNEITSFFEIAPTPTNSPTSPINVLCIGASTTANGEWASELKRRLTGNGGTPIGNRLNNIVFVGRKSLESSDIRPLPINVEATGGWAWKTFYTPQEAIRFTVSDVVSMNEGDTYEYYNQQSQRVIVQVAEVNVTSGSGNIRFLYNYNTVGKGIPSSIPGTLTKVGGVGDSTISYTDAITETYCPFYDEITQQPSFVSYANTYCNGSIDVAIFHLGTINSSIMGKDSLEQVIADMKTLLDALHQDFPNCKVIVGDGGNFGSHYGLEEDYNAASKYKTWSAVYAQFRYAQALDEIFNDSESDYFGWCYLANTFGEIDSENCFPIGEKSVNNRMSTTKEVIDTNGAHPTLAGYQMFADTFYRCFCNVILKQYQ